MLRFLLGVVEAGFFPGVVLYLTYWFPAKRRARVNGLFMTSFAIAGAVGGPIAGLIMNGMKAWAIWPTGNGCSSSKAFPP
jgi:MFS family permease